MVAVRLWEVRAASRGIWVWDLTFFRAFWGREICSALVFWQPSEAYKFYYYYAAHPITYD